jgi:hypothetical protein
METLIPSVDSHLENCQMNRGQDVKEEVEA